MPAGMGAEQVAKMYEGRDYEEVKLDGMRRTVAARLTEAKQTIPHFYLRRDIRLDALLKFRSQPQQSSWKGRGVKLSVNDFIIKGLRQRAAGRSRGECRLGRRPDAAAETPPTWPWPWPSTAASSRPC